jgi:AraC family transcriptional regulator of adaptative response/methylated-DNA-[protein]-cysteine methyltransferase
LLKIPCGSTVTYKDIACDIGRPRASRAVGNAVGANPVSLLIPCHRVIRASGIIDNYGWGSARKKLILAAEGALPA